MVAGLAAVSCRPGHCPGVAGAAVLVAVDAVAAGQGPGIARGGALLGNDANEHRRRAEEHLRGPTSTRAAPSGGTGLRCGDRAACWSCTASPGCCCWQRWSWSCWRYAARREERRGATDGRRGGGRPGPGGAGCSGGGDQEAAGPTSSAPAITIGGPDRPDPDVTTSAPPTTNWTVEQTRDEVLRGIQRNGFEVTGMNERDHLPRPQRPPLHRRGLRRAPAASRPERGAARPR